MFRFDSSLIRGFQTLLRTEDAHMDVIFKLFSVCLFVLNEVIIKWACTFVGFAVKREQWGCSLPLVIWLYSANMKMIWSQLLHDEEAETLCKSRQSCNNTVANDFIHLCHEEKLKCPHKQSRDCALILCWHICTLLIPTFWYLIHSILMLVSETSYMLQLSVEREKKKSQEKFYHCEKHLPPAIVSPSALTTPPASRHKKRRETPFSLLWVKQQISLMRAGCDYAFRKEKKKKVKKKKEKRGGGKWCSSSSTLEPVVHRLACAGCGWGCPALGPVWKQIYQVSARQKWMRTITQLSIVTVNEASLPEQPEKFPFFSPKSCGSISAQKSA